MAVNTWKTKALWTDIKSVLSSGKDVVVYDIETTGLSPTNERIIELAAIKFKVEEDFRLVETAVYHQYMNPQRELAQEIIDLTGITPEKLANMPTESECFDDIVAFFEDCIVSGYNIENFDNKFISELYARHGKSFAPVGSVDVIKMARNRIEREAVERYTLTNVGAYFGITFGAHSAIEDTRATSKVAQILINEYIADEFEAESAPAIAEGSLRPKILGVSFWPGFKGFSRIYVNMDIGSVYYDIRSFSWGGKDIDVNTIDMAWLTGEVFRLTGTSNETEFAQFKGSVSA